MADDIGPGFTAIARDLQIAIVCTGPNQILIQRRSADGEHSAVILCAGVVDGDSAGILLALFLLVVGG